MGTSIQSAITEDSTSTIKMVDSETTMHRTMHISTKVHHFKKYVRDNFMTIVHVPTNRQLADIFTKAVTPQLFKSIRHKLRGGNCSIHFLHGVFKGR